MDTFLLAMLLTVTIALGGRDQLVIAQFSQSLQRTGLLLATGTVCAVLSAAAMAVAGASIAAILPQRAADMLVAFALGFAAIELLHRVKIKPMKEPTRSYIAIGAVIFIRQIGDAARFVIFALAAAAVFPTTAAIGGAIGGVVAVAIGWGMGLSRLEALPLRAIRMVLAAGLFLAALVIGLNARYLFL